MDDDDIIDAVRDVDGVSSLFKMQISNWETLKLVIDKSELYRFMQERNLPCPKTWFVSSI